MRLLWYACSMVVFTGTGGCAYLTQGFDTTAVQVENQSTHDVDLYVWDATDRATRLGFLAAGDSAEFELPRSVTSAPGPYYMEARKLQGSEEPAYSEPFTIQEGATITWEIPYVEPFQEVF